MSEVISRSLIETYEAAFDALFAQSPYALNEDEKKPLFMACVNALEQHHRAQCLEYLSITKSAPDNASCAEDLPYLAVRLFKMMRLKSVADDQVFRVLQSSGTTSQTPAQVVLDANTSRRQSKVLVKILQSFLGKQRLPMLIIDAPGTVKPGSKFSARAAGIQGLSLFGRQPVFALHDDMTLNISAVQQFCDQHQDKPVLVFGFTFMAWQYWVRALEQAGMNISLPLGTLLHSGGWKKLIAQQVSNNEFKQRVANACGIQKVHNFYGMAEQVGSIFVECEHGHLHTPAFADICIRDPYTLDPLPLGQEGLIQVVSTVPSSYPGHSILTEDLGMITSIDQCPCGRKGKTFAVQGRLPAMEVRGCSDTV